MEEGRINIILGWLGAFLGMLIGAFLLTKLTDPVWAAHDYHPRALLRIVHFHGILFSFTNIFYGLTIGKTSLAGGLKTIGSWLAIIGMIVYPVAIFLGVFSPTLLFIAPLGALSLILAVAIMVYGQVFARV